jgi:ABC-type transporter Mla subunit MlaD
MSEAKSDRLDRIERILEQTAQLSQQTAQQQQQLASRFDGLVSETQRLFNRLGEQQSRTEAAVESLTDAVTRLTRNAEADRANFLQKAEADQARWTQNQAEIRQIWEYLLGQQRGNGRGEG